MSPRVELVRARVCSLRSPSLEQASNAAAGKRSAQVAGAPTHFPPVYATRCQLPIAVPRIAIALADKNRELAGVPLAGLEGAGPTELARILAPAQGALISTSALSLEAETLAVSPTVPQSTSQAALRLFGAGVQNLTFPMQAVSLPSSLLALHFLLARLTW